MGGFASLLASAVLADAREPAPLVATDRPGLGDGAWVLAPDVWQVEALGIFNDTGARRDGVGSVLLRHGLEDIELRLYLPSPSIIEQDDDSWSDLQWGDLGVGVKVPLGNSAAWDWSLVTAATLPTGSSAVTADAVTGFATLVGERKLSDTVGFAINAGANASAESSDAASVSLIPTLIMALGDSTVVYGGYAGFYGRGDDQHWVEAGVATGFSRLFEWGINSAYDTRSGDWFIGIGFSRRWLP